MLSSKIYRREYFKERKIREKLGLEREVVTDSKMEATTRTVMKIKIQRKISITVKKNLMMSLLANST